MDDNDSPIQLGLRVDVDTLRGTRYGVPALLNLFAQHNINASFFFTVGPDNMGRHLWRLLKPVFLLKMIRSNAASLYGWDILLRGTLWPGPEIGKRCAEIIRQTAQSGHEIGLHAWDHHHWQSNLEMMTLADIHKQIQLGYDSLCQILNAQSLSCSAVAGWKCNDYVLHEKSQFNFQYHSDCRGTSIFRPVIGGKVKLPQIPVTLPTYDEIIGKKGLTDKHYNEHILTLIKPGKLNVLTIHAEVEGLARSGLFTQFVNLAHKRKIQFVPLSSLLPTDCNHIPYGKIVTKPIEGREGSVCWQSSVSER